MLDKERVVTVQYLLNCIEDSGYVDVSDVYDKNEVQVIKESLEKQIPKKPFYRVEEDTEGYACPVCTLGVTSDRGRIRDTFCSHCGQLLDWSNG